MTTIELTESTERAVVISAASMLVSDKPTIEERIACSESSYATSKHVQTVVQASLAHFFVTYLPFDRRLKAVFWLFEGAMLRVWTVIDTDDFEFESRIYEAEKRFLQKLPAVQADFYVVFQQGRSLEDVTPSDAQRAYPVD